MISLRGVIPEWVALGPSPRKCVTLVGCLLLALPALLWAKPDVMFSSQGGIQRRLIQSIDHAGQTIDIAMFNLTAEPIFHALARAGKRGVAVRLILDATTRRTYGPDILLKGVPNIEVRSLGGRSRTRGLMHHKFAIIDSARMITGSYNWTQGAERSNYENALFVDDPELIARFQDEFSRLWKDAAQKRDSRSRRPRRKQLHK